MPLTDAQRETQIRIFTEQKELMKNHPFMDVDEDGTVKVNRERCIDFLQELAEAEFMLRAKQQAVVYFLEEDLRDRGEAEKKKIRAYDAAHRNLKTGNEIEAANRQAKKADGSVSKYEQMVLKVMASLKCSRDAAVKFIEED